MTTRARSLLDRIGLAFLVVLYLVAAAADILRRRSRTPARITETLPGASSS